MSCRIVHSALVAVLFTVAPAMAQPPTMDALWPSQDGMSWTYAQRYEDLELPQVVDTRTRIFLDGTVVAPIAIQAQYLRQELIGGSAISLSFEPVLTDPFMRQLWLARPDLRTRILQEAADADCPRTGAPGWRSSACAARSVNS